MERLPPHDLEAEDGMLAAMMRYGEAAQSATLHPREFYHGGNGLIYDAIVAMVRRREEPDLITLPAELSRRKHLEASGGYARIAGLLTSPGYLTQFDHYQRIVHEKAMLRDLIDAGAKVVKLGYDEHQDLDVTMAQAVETVRGVALGADKRAGRTYEEALRTFLADLEERWDGGATYDSKLVPTSFHRLDRAMNGGFQGGELIVIGGRPGAAKSAMMLQIAHNVARRERAVRKDPRWTMIFSSEMTLSGLLWRALAEVTRMPASEIRAGVTLPPARKAFIREKLAEMARLPIWIDDASQPTTDQIRQRVERFMTERPVSMVMFDYLQQAGNKTRDRNGNNEQRIAGISLALKHLAKSADVPVVALAQLNRGVELRADKHPMMADLRDSGQIEQDADKILFLYRQDYYEDQGIPIAIDPAMKGKCEVELAKNRDGAPGRFVLDFLPEITAFREAA